MTVHHEGTHLDHADLAAALDGDIPSDGGAHLETCDRCAHRLRRLHEDAESVRALIAEVDLPPGFRLPTLPPEETPGPILDRWSRGQLRIAAGLLVLVFVAGVPPVRAWVVERTEWVVSELASLVGPSDSPVALADAEADGSALLLDPGSGELAISLRQPSGTLRLRTATGPDTRVEILGGDLGAELVGTPDGVRIRNSAGSAGIFDVAVQAGVAVVHVRVGDRVRSFAAEELASGVIVDLRDLSSGGGDR
jgi:hypothetical protein